MQGGDSIRVLYLNHYGVFRGAQRSMLELVRAFPPNAVTPYFITPKGDFIKYLEKSGYSYSKVFGGISKFDHSRVGYYRGLRWLILLREFAFLFPTFFVFYSLRRRAKDIDIIHINEITCLLPLILARKLFKKPVIAHARVVLNSDKTKWRTRMVNRVLRKFTDHIIAIDETVASNISAGQKVSVIHNSFEKAGAFVSEKGGFRAKLDAITRRKLTVGYIGAIHVNKGVFDLLEAARLCAQNGLDVNFIIAGGRDKASRTSNAILKNMGFSHDGNDDLYAFIDDNKLNDYVHPIGFSSDTADFFSYIDVNCFPSYYDAPGRSVFEAAFFSKPTIAAISNPLPDTFIDGKTGLKVEAANPRSIYDAIRHFYDNAESINEMGAAAYALATNNFDPQKNAASVLAIYRSLVSTHQSL
jgi:glycosyltransferase involved in cell wall biosynthesis